MTKPDSWQLGVDAALDAIVKGALPDNLESEFLDFKQDAREGPEATVRILAEAAICFANASGGTIVVGVADDVSGTAALLGTRLTPREVRERLWDLIDPSLAVAVQEVDSYGPRLLVVRVPESPVIHCDRQGRAHRRIGTTCHPLTPIEQVSLREEKAGRDWSGEPSGRPSSDVSPLAMEVVRDLLRRHPDRERGRLARLPDVDLQRELGALTRDGRLSNAGAILLCPEAGTSERVLYVHRDTPGGEPTEIRRLSDPLVTSFEAVMASVAARRRLTPVTLLQGQQIHLEDFPVRAVRELLSNALIHRDYHLPGPIAVSHSPQIFEVSSPGPLVSGVTPANILTHESKPRNPALAKAVRLLGLAEEVGVGIDRVYREMLASGRDLPIIESFPDRVRVALIGGASNIRIPYYLSRLPAEEQEDVDTLLTLFTLCHRRTLRAEELAPVLQKSEQAAEAVLRRLSQDSVAMLEPSRGTLRNTHPRYRLRAEAIAQLGTAVAYNRRPPDEVDRKVVAHVQEYGKVTNRTVKNLLDVDVYRAADVLRDLVERGILVKTSQATRGPSVQYGPGPAFPRGRR